MLPPGHAEPGAFRSRRTPYMIPFMRAFTQQWKTIVLVCGSQMGKTDSVANVFGSRLDDDPVPMIYLGPTKSFVEKTWEPRFVEMISSASRLSAHMKRGRGSTKTQKEVRGVKVNFSWAGSAAAIAGDPACIVIVDERDRMVSDVEGEGDPVALANARHSTYPDGKTGVISTPLLGNVEVYRHKETQLEHWAVGEHEEIQSPTWRLWQSGTRHEFMVPCPHCGEYFAPRFRHLHWPENSALEDLTEQSVLLHCIHCGAGIDESRKQWMIERGLPVSPGEFVVNGEIMGRGPPSDAFTLWVSGFCSPWRSWAMNAREYVNAARSGDSETLQAIINTRFGELYAVSGESPDWEEVGALRVDYRQGDIPEGVITLILTVDVQKESLYYVLRGWSKHQSMKSWLIEHGQLFGDTNAPEVWDELAEFRTRLFGENQSLKIRRCFVDMKYRVPAVFAFCNRHRKWAFPIVGRMPKSETPEAQRPLDSQNIDINRKGETIPAKKGGLRRYTVNTDFFKRWIHDQLALGPKSVFLLPSDAEDDYCKQLVAEARIVKPNGRAMWVQSSRDNHYLDCEMMQIACAWSLRLQKYAHPKTQPRTQTDVSSSTEAAERLAEAGGTELQAEAPPRRRAPMPPKRRRNWARQW